MNRNRIRECCAGGPCSSAFADGAPGGTPSRPCSTAPWEGEAPAEPFFGKRIVLCGLLCILVCGPVLAGTETGRQQLALPAPGETEQALVVLREAVNAEDDVRRDAACRRMVALVRAGLVSASDVEAHQAWYALAQSLAGQGKLVEADRLIESAGEYLGRNAEWTFNRSCVLHAAGRFDAGRGFAELLAAGAENHSDSLMRDLWQRIHGNVAYRKSAEQWTERQGRPQIPRDQPKSEQYRHRWEGLAVRPIGEDARAYDQLIRDALKDDVWLPLPGVRAWSSLWLLIDVELRSRPADELEPLRIEQEALLRDAYDQAHLDGMRAPEHIDVFRRYPWAPGTHALLIRYARDELWAGRADLAARSYEDVLAHSDDPHLREQAEQGLALALKGVKEDNHSAPGAGDSITLDRLESVRVRPPDVVPWPYREGHPPGAAAFDLDMRVEGERLVIGAPNVLAVYDKNDLRQPLWAYAVPANTAFTVRRPGHFNPAIRGERLYTRWGYNSVPQDVAAVSLASGDMHWSTAQKTDWEKPAQFARQAPWPVADPVAASGNRLYVLSYQLFGEHARYWDFMNGRYSQKKYLFVSGEGGRFRLHCLNASTGEPYWSAEVMHQPLRIGNKYRGAEDVIFDAALHGNAVTLDHGLVISDLSAGHIVCSDARNGAVLWRFNYPRTRGESSPYKGMSPRVRGATVFCSPRDYAGLLALDRESGRLRWQQSLVRPMFMAGLVEHADGTATLVGHDGTQVFGVNAEDGSVRWCRDVGQALLASARISEGRVLLGTRVDLLLVDGLTGKIVEQRNWNTEGSDVRAFASDGATVFTYAPGEVTPLDAPDRGFDALPRDVHDFPRRFGGDAGDVNVVLRYGRLTLVGLDPQTAALRWVQRMREPIVGLEYPMSDAEQFTFYGDQTRFVMDRRSGRILASYPWDRARNRHQSHQMRVTFAPDGRNMLFYAVGRPDLHLRPLETDDAWRHVYGTGAERFTWRYAVPPDLRTDGYLDDWQAGVEPLTLRADSGDPAAPVLQVAQGPDRVLLSTDYVDERFAPFQGRGRFAFGDWITLWISDEEGVRTARFGVGEHGAVVGDGERIDYVEAGIRQDAATGRHVVEVAIPAYGTPVVVQARVQEEAGTAGRRYHYGPTILHRHPFSRRQVDAVSDLVRVAPDSPQARLLWHQVCEPFAEWPVKRPSRPMPASTNESSRLTAMLAGEVDAFSMTTPQGLTYARGVAAQVGVDALPTQDWKNWVRHYNRVESELQGPFDLDARGFIKDWLVLGWFPNPGPDKAREGLDIDYLWAHGTERLHLPENGVHLVTHTGHPATWTRYRSPNHMISFNRMPHLARKGVHKHRHRIVVYNACWLEVDRDMDVELRIGSDDGHKLFLDHELVMRQQYWGPAKTDYWRYPVHLTKGLHMLMVKVENRDGLSRFLIRVTDAAGQRVDGVKVKH